MTYDELYAAMDADTPGAETEFSLRDWLARNPQFTRDSVEPYYVLKARKQQSPIATDRGSL